jgi:CubicO group peptidase (beta-lactamase class C family)
MKSIIDYFNNEIQVGHIHCASCAVYKNEKELFRGDFGYADVAQTKKLQGNEIFRLASMTKPITAVAVMIAVERGLLDLDKPLGTYINGFHHSGVGKIENGEIVFVRPAREITLRDILCHTSGLATEGEVAELQFKRRFPPKPRILKDNVYNWNGAFLDFAPCEIHTRYGGLVPFEFAAYAVECVTKMPFGEFLKREIFEPLGMYNTTYVLNREQKKRMVDVCRMSESGNLESVDYGFAGFHPYEEGYHGGSAGLFSTVDDIAPIIVPSESST